MIKMKKQECPPVHFWLGEAKGSFTDVEHFQRVPVIVLPNVVVDEPRGEPQQCSTGVGLLNFREKANLMRSIILVFLSAVVGLTPHSLRASARYSITGLDFGGESIRDVAINNSGLIALTSHLLDDIQPNKVFLLDHGQMIELATLGGRWSHIADINNNGVLAGSSETLTGLSYAVQYENGIIQDLGTIMPTGVGIAAINDSGISVGRTLGPHHNRAVVANGPNDFAILGTLGGDYSSASDINNLGQITGISFTGKEFLPVPTAGPFDEAFLYENGQMIGIGGLGGLVSYGYAINDLSQIVGFSSLANDEQHAFVWDKVDGMRDLGTPGLQSFATHINNRGTIVGLVEVTPGNLRAAIFDETSGYRLLQDLIPANSGWGALGYATDINDLGRIVGTGVVHGQNRAFLLTPTPEPSSLVLLSFCAGFLSAVRLRFSCNL
jgi:probable HAF family extracellular repeat protein